MPAPQPPVRHVSQPPHTARTRPVPEVTRNNLDVPFGPPQPRGPAEERVGDRQSEAGEDDEEMREGEGNVDGKADEEEDLYE